MKNISLRIIISAVFLPYLGFIIFIIPHHNHMAFNITTITVAFLASLEVEKFFCKKQIPIWRYLPSILSCSLPLYTYIEISDIKLFGFDLIPQGYFPLWITALITIVFIRSINLKNAQSISETLESISASLVVILYPGLFLSYIVRLTDLPYPKLVLLIFLTLIFINDIMAYFSGKLLGKYFKLNLPISPNKTLIGFITGFLASIGTALFYSFILKSPFTLSVLGALLLGSVIGLAAILGDLIESAMKRAAEVKDSGVIMPGRGGLMDTIDSLLLCAPLFYFLFPLLIN